MTAKQPSPNGLGRLNKKNTKIMENLFLIILMLAGTFSLSIGLMALAYKQRKSTIDVVYGETDDPYDEIYKTTPSITEDEYEIVGTCYCDLSSNDMRYSDDCFIMPYPNSLYDDNAIAVYIYDKKVGYISKDRTDEWHKYFSTCKNSPHYHCRGYIDERPNGDGGVRRFGSVFLPKEINKT